MNRYLVIVYILISLFLFSCKQESGCYECTTTFKITERDGTLTNSWSVYGKNNLCDKTPDEISEFEIRNSDTTFYINGNIRIDTIKITTCIK